MINTNLSNINHSAFHPVTHQSSKTNPYASNSGSVETPSSIVTISPEAHWANIAEKYDVTNISPNEVRAMGKELYDKKLISEKEALLIWIPLSMDESPNQKSNYLEAMYNDLNAAKKFGYSTQKEGIMEKRISILERLNSFSGNTSNAPSITTIGSKYDVTNMTEKEMGAMSKELFDSGLIGSLEFSVMSFSSNQMKENIGISVNVSEKNNYLEHWQNSLIAARQQNLPQAEIKTREHIVNILKNL